jgi:transcriptional regulator with XRE-family HTH domain
MGITSNSFGDKLRAIRHQKKLTQEKVCEQAGIHPKYLSEIERGNKVPSVTVLQQLASALQVPVCEVMSSDYCPYKGKRSTKAPWRSNGAGPAAVSKQKPD